MVDAFAGLVRERLRSEDSALRKAYVALFVSEVAIYQDQIRISGSTRMLERAVGNTEPAIMGMVPILTGNGAPEMKALGTGIVGKHPSGGHERRDRGELD